MIMNFENKDGRQDYLNKKLDDLIEGINASYGQSLLNELVKRLHRTIEDFNEEFEGIIGDLKDNSERRNQIIHDLMEGKELAKKINSSPSNNSNDDENDDENDDAADAEPTEMSAWEKRLEGLE